MVGVLPNQLLPSRPNRDDDDDDDDELLKQENTILS